MNCRARKLAGLRQGRENGGCSVFILEKINLNFWGCTLLSDVVAFPELLERDRAFLDNVQRFEMTLEGVLCELSNFTLNYVFA